eukprot:TRINITY_DN33043_c0_g1_i1.p1 TRINITY_DN33043_c0_g1~~TRINITY_DN33043_c0_g1_i1.p1  ORF type:complete len:321 (+),score=84.17 TRINITY_DN33043_c0_g1_i1:138-1100(+)
MAAAEEDVDAVPGFEETCQGSEDVDIEDEEPATGKEGGQWTRPDLGPERFHWVPKNGWDRFAKGLNCGARNVIPWKGRGPVPVATSPCWFLPASDFVAVQIAARQAELREAGWKVLTCDSEEVVIRLSDKAKLWEHIVNLGLRDHVPQCFAVDSPDDAAYPCILKSATGEFGKDCHIVRSAEDVRKIISSKGTASKTKWVFQELVRGKFEYSVSLLVVKGVILESAGMEYEYDREEYYYPQVKQVRKQVVEAEPEHLAIMQQVVQEYSGLCNFNFKIRDNGSMAIFEINTRIGGDLAVDIPRKRAREIFERLDSLEGADT